MWLLALPTDQAEQPWQVLYQEHHQGPGWGLWAALPTKKKQSLARSLVLGLDEMGGECWSLESREPRRLGEQTRGPAEVNSEHHTNRHRGPNIRCVWSAGSWDYRKKKDPCRPSRRMQRNNVIILNTGLEKSSHAFSLPFL